MCVFEVVNCFSHMQAHRQRLRELGLWPTKKCISDTPVAQVHRYAPEFGVALETPAQRRKRTKRTLCNALARSKPTESIQKPVVREKFQPQLAAKQQPEPDQPQQKPDKPLQWHYDPQFWNKYEILRSMQAGAFGKIYEAKDRATSKPVAIKILTHVDKYTQYEVSLMRAALDDRGKCTPGIVCYVDHAKVPWPVEKPAAEPKFAIVMEFLKGTDLLDIGNQFFLSRKKPSSADVRQWLRTALESLARLHDQGIAHRDIKPNNLRIVENRAVVLDLGLSCFADDEKRTPQCSDSADLVLGTPCYSMAPDRFENTDDATILSSDVYAIALSFWFIVTGREPSSCAAQDQGKPIREAVAAFRRPKKPEMIYADDPVVAQVLYDMLEPNASDRPTAREAAQRLA